jgi:transposase-like protein
LERFARRALEVEFPYLILDARYEKVHEEGVIRLRAVLVAIGIDWGGRPQILAVEIASRESTTSWRELRLALKQRGLSGVRLTISTDHPDSSARWPKCCPRRAGSVATSTSCATRSTISHARPTTTA